MPPEAQTRLLRVLQEGEYMTVGGRDADQGQCPHRRGHPSRPAPPDPAGPVPRGSVLSPERRADPPAAACASGSTTSPSWPTTILRAATADGLPSKVLSPDAMARLKQHRWPGNVRELVNLVRRLSALYSEEVIGVETIEAELADAISGHRAGARGRRCRQQRHLAGRRRRPPSAGAFCRPWRAPAAGRHVRSCHFRGRAAAAVPGAGRNAREPVARCPSPGAQSQYVAQEDQGPRRPRGTHAAGSPRRVIW